MYPILVHPVFAYFLLCECLYIITLTTVTHIVYLQHFPCSYSRQRCRTSKMSPAARPLPRPSSPSRPTTTSARTTTTAPSHCGRCRTSPTTTPPPTSRARTRRGIERPAESLSWSLSLYQRPWGFRILWSGAPTGSVSNAQLLADYFTSVYTCVGFLTVSVWSLSIMLCCFSYCVHRYVNLTVVWHIYLSFKSNSEG